MERHNRLGKAVVALGAFFFLAAMAPQRGPSPQAGVRPVLEIRDNVATVTQQGRALFRLPLTLPEKIKARTATGREYDAERRDFAFLAGRCLLVQRGAVPGELYDSVDHGEIYNVFTRQRSVHPGEDARYWGGRIFSPPSAKWAVMMQEEEGILYGYYLLGPDCSLTSHKLEKSLFAEGQAASDVPPAETEASITINYRENDGQAWYTVVINKDGSHKMNEMPKR
jgi:hypothetical protein